MINKINLLQSRNVYFRGRLHLCAGMFPQLWWWHPGEAPGGLQGGRRTPERPVVERETGGVQGRLVHLDVEDYSEKLLPQQSYVIKNQLGHPKPQGLWNKKLLGLLRWFFMALGCRSVHGSQLWHRIAGEATTWSSRPRSWSLDHDWKAENLLGENSPIGQPLLETLIHRLGFTNDSLDPLIETKLQIEIALYKVSTTSL